MFLVVAYHSPPRLEVLDEVFIFNLRMPVFFAMAGFLFNAKKYNTFGKYLKQRAKQIIVPYIVFFVFFYVLWLVVGRRMVGGEEMAVPPLQPLWEFVMGRPEVVVQTFWYLACLFTIQIIYYWIQRWTKGYWRFVVALALNLSLFVLPDADWMRTWNFDRALVFMPLYAFGDCFRDYIKQVDFSRTGQTFAIILLALVGCGALYFGRQAVPKSTFYVLRVEVALMLLPAVLAIFKAIAKRLPISPAARTVVITGTIYLAFQNYFIGIIKIILTKCCGEGIFDEHIWLKLVIALVVMVAIYPFAAFINRRMPWALGKGPLFDRL